MLSANVPIFYIPLYSGFMHAHVSYLTDDCPACLFMLTVEQDAFANLSSAKEKIVMVSFNIRKRLGFKTVISLVNPFIIEIII